MKKPKFASRRTVGLGMPILLLLAFWWNRSSEPPPPASLVISGARVWTGDPRQPWAEAVACRGETIVAVGSATDVMPWIGTKTAVIQAPGRMLVPGFIDSHVHLLAGGSALASVQLRDATTPEAFTERIAQLTKTLQPGEWILGGAWDHTLWGGELPHRDWIDAVTPDHPVWILRLDGHMGLANSLALERAGVTADTAEVEGGTIDPLPVSQAQRSGRRSDRLRLRDRA